MEKVSSRKRVQRAVGRNRALVVALLAVGALVAVLNGIGGAQGEWYPQIAAPSDSQFPTARFGAATTFDATNSEMVIFGGFTNSVGSAMGVGSIVQSQIGLVNRGDTWVYQVTNKKWSKRDSIHAPSPRGFASMAYDDARRNTILFGGARYRDGNSVSGETWTWDGKDWTLQNPPEPRPVARQNAVMAYDAHRKVVVMFGGRGATTVAFPQGEPLNDTWTWDGSKWAIMPSAGAPSPRHSAAMAYDVCNAQAVMFGGLGPAEAGSNFPTQPAETWTWDGVKWTSEDQPVPSPPGRIGAGMGYSNLTGRVLLYGGLVTTDSGHQSVAADTDVWRWDGASNAWEKMNSDATTLAFSHISTGTPEFGGPPPPPRAYPSFASAPVQNRDAVSVGFHLFGGTPTLDTTQITTLVAGSLGPQVALGDQFRFSEPGHDGTGTDDPISNGSVAEGDLNPLTRRCVNPVPIPSDGAPIDGVTKETEAPQVQTREGMQEIGQLPVLEGTDWPGANRNTHISSTKPNPDYTPPPDCPNRTKVDSFGNATGGITPSW